MEHPANNLVLAVLLLGATVSPAIAQNYDYLSRSDTISMSAGNAAQSNITIQTETPWPPYVNNTRIPGNGLRGSMAIDQLNQRYAQPPEAQPPPPTGTGTGTGVGQ